MGIPSIDRPGYEADDLIGTLAKGWVESNADKKCVIVTADKDMMQLVNEQVSIWDGKEKYRQGGRKGEVRGLSRPRCRSARPCRR